MLCQSYQFSSQISSLYIVKEGDIRKTYPVIDSPIHGKHDGTSYMQLHMTFHLYIILTFHLYSKHLLSQCLLYKSIIFAVTAL